MSKLIALTATGTFGPLNGGFHLASIKLVGGTSATILDGTATAMMMAAVAGGSDFWVTGDCSQGAVFSAVASVSALSGGTLIVEEY